MLFVVPIFAPKSFDFNLRLDLKTYLKWVFHMYLLWSFWERFWNLFGTEFGSKIGSKCAPPKKNPIPKTAWHPRPPKTLPKSRQDAFKTSKNVQNHIQDHPKCSQNQPKTS